LVKPYNFADKKSIFYTINPLTSRGFVDIIILAVKTAILALPHGQGHYSPQGGK
jgi:hypothetical protein